MNATTDSTPEDDVEAADVANGEPDATNDHETGDAQAAESRENDPPA